jgi:NAD(P)H-hydrate epimerase
MVYMRSFYTISIPEDNLAMFPCDPNVWRRYALLTNEEMRRAEAKAYGAGTASYELMRRAGRAVVEQLLVRWQRSRVLVLCGPGNNGGDGFIAAEELRREGWDIVVAAAEGAGSKGDAAKAAKDWQGKTLPLRDIEPDNFDLIIDALFGIGLTRPIEGEMRAVFDKIAKSKAHVIAVDVPSGLNSDNGSVMGAAIKAGLTVTFFRKKPGHVLLPGREYCGDVMIADIGIPDDVLNEINPLFAENQKDLWIDQFPFPKPEGHKYERGHALIAGGAVMTGATRLGARAAQRIGAGLVTLAAPQSAVALYSEALESVIVREADSVYSWQELLADPKRNVVLIGPGLGIGEMQASFVCAALDSRKPCVLDADALTNFADRPEDLITKLHAQCVLTPHEGEFARLFGSRIDERGDKISRACAAAKIAGCIVLLKGADTVIASPEGRAVVNVNAPPWLATAGAGDVLAGMILGLLAQNMPVFAAAAAAAWMHGAVADIFGPGLIAEDLVAGIPNLLRGLPEGIKGV